VWGIDMAFLAPMVASSGFQMAMAGVSALGKISAGAAQKRQYQAQAEQAELRGRSEAIAYKQKGADALRNLNQTLAAIISRSAAGGVDPTSGSAATLQQFAMGEGVREFNIAADNAVMALGQASAQSSNYKQAGQAAQLSSFVSAAGSLGQGAYRYGQLA
tara:strand:+ start:519 stop:998 length:480 start_codon:yes stop_codon:yes gene_type:complete